MDVVDLVVSDDVLLVLEVAVAGKNCSDTTAIFIPRWTSPVRGEVDVRVEGERAFIGATVSDNAGGQDFIVDFPKFFGKHFVENLLVFNTLFPDVGNGDVPDN